MIKHSNLGDTAFGRLRGLKHLIDSGGIIFGGNRKLKIYAMLNCPSGKRMKVENRVFFSDEQDAVNQGYQPCGNCMKVAYQKWHKAILKSHVRLSE